MLRLYRQTAALAFRRAFKAWPVAFSLIVYAVIMRFAAMLAGNLGLIGGFVLGLAAAACGAGYLHLLSLAVRGQKVSFEDLKTGFKELFSTVISALFALWIIGFVVSALVQGAGPNGPAIAAMVGLAMAFFLNPLPEMIYLQEARSFQLLLASARFVLAHPVAWFLPNLLFWVVLLAPTGALHVQQPGELLLLFGGSFSLGGMAQILSAFPLWALPILLLFLHYVMVFRGLLFQGLSSGNTSRRQQWIEQSRR